MVGGGILGPERRVKDEIQLIFRDVLEQRHGPAADLVGAVHGAREEPRHAQAVGVGGRLLAVGSIVVADRVPEVRLSLGEFVVRRRFLNADRRIERAVASLAGDKGAVAQDDREE